MSRRPIVFRAAAACAALGIGGFFAWVVTGFAGERATTWFDDVGEMVAALIAVAGAAFAARRHRGRGRMAWSLLAASAAAWAAGEAAWTWYEMILGRTAFPSPADIGFLGAVPAAIAAALILPGAGNRTLPRVTAVLDGVIMAAGLLAVSWVTVLRPVYEAGGDTLLARTLSLAYPVSDAILVTMLLILAIRTGRRARIPYFLLVAGLGATAVADSSFAYLSTLGRFGAGNAVDTGWVAGYLLVALAGLRAGLWPVGSAARDESPSRFGLAVPYVPVLAGTVIAVDEEITHRHIDIVLFAVFITLVSVVVTRQLLTLAENIRLVRRLGARERQLVYQAQHDALTDLANRTLLHDRIVIALDEPEAGTTAVMFIDLDDFKNVNDTLGHAAGDHMLRIIAGRLRACVRPEDTAARLGGDEFGILVAGVPTPRDVVAIAERILAAIAEPVTVDGSELRTQGTVGIAMADAPGVTCDELLRRADVAMYMGKARGKGLLSIHEPSYDLAVTQRVARLEATRRRAAESALPQTL